MELRLELEQVPLKEKILERRHSLLCLLPIVFLGEGEELDQERVGRDRVFLDQHSERGDFISSCTLCQHREVPLSIF